MDPLPLLKSGKRYPQMLKGRNYCSVYNHFMAEKAAVRKPIDSFPIPQQRILSKYLKEIEKFGSVRSVLAADLGTSLLVVTNIRDNTLGEENKIGKTQAKLRGSSRGRVYFSDVYVDMPLENLGVRGDLAKSGACLTCIYGRGEAVTS